MKGFAFRATGALALGAGLCLASPASASDPAAVIQEARCGACAADSCDEWCKRPGLFQRIARKLRDCDYEQFHPDHCWPEQYSRESERRVNAPLGAQMVAGHRLESTIWEHYWAKGEEGEAPKLNEAGMSRLQYLARKRPYVIPQLELQTSFNQELDAQRSAALTAYAASVSTQPIPWSVVLTNRGAAVGLFGQEGPKAIDKMIGVAGQPPRYEPNIKQGFLSTSETGTGQ